MKNKLKSQSPYFFLLSSFIVIQFSNGLALADQITREYSEKISGEKTLIKAAKIAVKTLENKTISQLTNNTNSVVCLPLNPLSLTTVSEDQYQETDNVEPFREMATSAFKPISSKSSENGWDQISFGDSDLVEGFSITNDGPNDIVIGQKPSLQREIKFLYPDRARSDIKLVIWDSPDGRNSHLTISVMLFFPRTILPSIKKIGEELEVTLPNKEIIRFNAKTHEVSGGVFEEGPIAQRPNGKAFPPNIKYTGNGVMIRADKSGDLPYGDIELPNGKSAPSISTAIVSKKGFKDCSIPAKDLWYTDHQKGGIIFIKPNLASDEGMDAFIKKKCGFSLY
jgi:hypothetical protein